MKRHVVFVNVAAMCLSAAVFAQGTAREQLARGKARWDQRLSKSAIEALESATRDPSTAAEAHETLGRIYTFKGWQQESAFPGWHDEPTLRARAISELKAERDVEIEVAGPNLAQSLTELGLIDEYRIYLHPVVLGAGKRYFAGPRPPLRLVAHDRIGDDIVRLAYVPA